ncbi:MAG: CinA family protein [Devosiaceae bacterium]|nr:CinA family protein [Devosiaceae bacterium]
MFPDPIMELSAKTVQSLKAKNMNICTAESCTGGLIVSALTSVPGSSTVVYGGFITYANEAKIAMVDVPSKLISQHGAVSQDVAIAMAQGALKQSKSDISIAVTGIAGPGGGTAEKPVGLVHFSCATKERTHHQEMKFGDLGREAIRMATVKKALEMVLKTIVDQP